jgi:hypothetical protein
MKRQRKECDIQSIESNFLDVHFLGHPKGTLTLALPLCDSWQAVVYADVSRFWPWDRRG